MRLSKSILLSAVLFVALIQTTLASVYSQLHFMKIESPRDGQDIKAGSQLVVKYVMQPLIDEQTSPGKALGLDINFHRRSGNQKQQQLGFIHKKCPVAAKNDKYVTYTKKWTIPSDTKPGSYAVDFVEKVQFRRTQITATETVKINSGETLSATGFNARPGGKGANQSVAIAKGGGAVYHAGLLGNDAQWIKDFMIENGVDMSHTRISETEGNGRAFIQVSTATGDNCIVLFPGTNAKYTPEDAAKVLESFGPGDWIVMQNEISCGGEIMNLAADKGLSVLFNPAPMTPGIVDEFPFDKVTVLIVNEHEAEDLYRDLGGQSKGKGGLDLAAELLKRFPHMQGVVVTLGGEGVVAKFRQEEDRIRDFIIPCQKVDVKDTTGAGDTFVGYFLATFVRAQNEDYFTRVQYALEEANVAASIAVTRLGSMNSVPTLDEVKAVLKK
ncbi:Ribokinase-like protein [Phascolomyces articulosus]|uniref:Ribokinase-like protein n=1 Tax=Phascolomyces articulosus TaxID=60185 RepID=A0AAD5K7T4_9FUNG|nr:Ribokinase-like protein [Phascolomyces articulosus]